MSYQGQIWQPPPATGWTWYNQTTNAKVITVGNGSLAMYVPRNSAGGGTDISGYYFTAPSTPYTVIANLTCDPVDAHQSTTVSGPLMFGFTDGTKTLAIMTRIYFNAPSAAQALYVSYAANSTTLTLDIFSDYEPSKYSYPQANWFMLRDDGTNVYFYISQDGLNFTKIISDPRTAHLTPSSIFWGGNPWGAIDINLTLNSWQILPF